MLRSLLQRHARVVLSISQAHISHTERDPLTGGERFELLRDHVHQQALERRVDIVPVPFDSFQTCWVPWIRVIAPRFDTAYARNPLIREILAYWDVTLEPLDLERSGSATEVRRRMVSDADWTALVPASIAAGLHRLRVPERVAVLATGRNV